MQSYYPYLAEQLPYPMEMPMYPPPIIYPEVKPRKLKKTNSKSLLPKTLESEKQAQEEVSQLSNQFVYPQGALPKLQSDLSEVPLVNPKKSQKKPRQDNMKSGHWSSEEHSTYIKFLEQYESIMTSSMMKKTSKIFKQMSELIGTRTPSQCRSHHQKFNPYALRGENGKRLPRTERSRAGRKKKILTDQPKEENMPMQEYDLPQDPYYINMMQQYYIQKQFENQPWPMFDYDQVKEEHFQMQMPTQDQYEDYLKFYPNYPRLIPEFYEKQEQP